jgi:ABC-type sugar transport system ATPase subunit
MTDLSDVVLEARGISKAFPGVQALNQVDLTLRRGRLTALLGENGAGKSTLTHVITGLFPPDQGTLRVSGREVHFANPREAQAAGIATIFQELNLIPHLSIAENVFLGCEPLTRLGLIDDTSLSRHATALLAPLGLHVDPQIPVAHLRLGQQQLVEIAKAIARDARILILDEPTSALSEQETAALFRLISGLKAQGVSLAYITHKLDELPAIADDVVVLRDGRLVGAAPLHQLTQPDLVRMMVGRDLANLVLRSTPTPGAEALRAEEISLAHPERAGMYLLESVSFQVHHGEVLGVFGLLGAGRTELLETVFGLHPHRSTGRLFLDGQPVSIRSPAEAIAHGLALAPEDRKREGLILDLSVAANASLASLTQIERFGYIPNQAEHRHVARYMDRFHVKTSSLEQPIRHLSGGNQQKVILAKWLAAHPQVLLLDEPTRGIDLHAKREIYGLIHELARAGLAVLVVSSELPEILAIADRVLVLCEGRTTLEVPRAEASEEILIRAALPCPLPVLDRTGADGPGHGVALRPILHSGKRLEHSSPDLGQPLSLDRHDLDHSFGRD